MGYITCFSGNMQFSNKKSYDFAKLCFDSKNEDIYSLYDSNFEDETLSINIYEDWKDYDDTMVSICLMALEIDKDVIINIECSGEERDDLWAIETKNKEIKVVLARIIYDDFREINKKTLRNENYLKKLYNITKDDNIAKEIMLNKLEKEK